MCQPTVAQPVLLFPQFCGIMTALNENAGYSTYNSLQVEAEKRMSHGLMFLGSYAWSTFIGSGADQQIGASYRYPGLISPFQRGRNKALDAQDVPHTLSMTTLYELPMGPVPGTHTERQGIAADHQPVAAVAFQTEHLRGALRKSRRHVAE